MGYCSYSFVNLIFFSSLNIILAYLKYCLLSPVSPLLLGRFLLTAFFFFLFGLYLELEKSE